MRKLLSFWIALALLIGCAVPALPWWQSIQQVGVGGGGGVATAFDPATAFGQLAFASSNTNVSHTGGGNTSDGVWTVAGTTTNQKVYVETAIGGVAFTILMGFSNDKTLSGNR